MHVDRRNNRISDTRIFSPLLGRLSKYGALRGWCFCVDNQISDGLAKRGISVTGSKESSGKGSVNAFRNVMQKMSIGVSMDKTLTGVGFHQTVSPNFLMDTINFIIGHAVFNQIFGVGFQFGHHFFVCHSASTEHNELTTLIINNILYQTIKKLVCMFIC